MPRLHGLNAPLGELPNVPAFVEVQIPRRYRLGALDDAHNALYEHEDRSVTWPRFRLLPVGAEATQHVEWSEDPPPAGHKPRPRPAPVGRWSWMLGPELRQMRRRVRR